MGFLWKIEGVLVIFAIFLANNNPLYFFISEPFLSIALNYDQVNYTPQPEVPILNILSLWPIVLFGLFAFLIAYIFFNADKKGLRFGMLSIISITFLAIVTAFYNYQSVTTLDGFGGLGFGLYLIYVVVNIILLLVSFIALYLRYLRLSKQLEKPLLER